MGRQFLASHQSLFLDDAEGAVIAVESGTVWVTMENDTRDIVLVPGMRFEIDRSGRTIVAAEEDTRRGYSPSIAPGLRLEVQIAQSLRSGWSEAPLRKRADTLRIESAAARRSARRRVSSPPGRSAPFCITAW